MLIKEASTILQKANTVIASLGSSIIDKETSPQYPSLAKRLDISVQYYDYLLKFIEFNDAGDTIVGTTGENDDDLNAILVKLQHELKLTSLTLPSPIVSIVQNNAASTGLTPVESSGASITLPLSSIYNNMFYAIDEIAGNKTIVFTGRGLRQTFFFSIDQAGRELTWPSSVKMENAIGDWNALVWTAPSAGDYWAELVFNRTNWLMVINGEF